MKQKNPTAFSELRSSAGILPTQIALNLGVPIATVTAWDHHGCRPQWRFIPLLARTFGIDLAQAVTSLWNETPGDRCPCGCTGEKIYPTTERSIHLYIKHICKCGRSRVFKSNQHTKGCSRCRLGDKLLPWVKLSCVGYRVYGARLPRFSKGCPRSVMVRQGRSRYQRRTTDEGFQFPFMNEVLKKYRCGRCASSFRLLQNLDARVREFLRKAKPRENPPKIVSLKQLIELQKACYKLSYTDRHGQAVSFHPTARQRGVKNPHHGDSRPRSQAFIKSMLAGFARRRLPKNIHGICLICDKILLSQGGYKNRIPKVHRSCLLEYQLAHGPHSSPTALASKRRPGAPVELENLRKYYAMTIRHQLGGEPLASVGDDYKVSKQAVAKGIRFILGHLPAPDQVGKQFKRRISMLLDPSLIPER